MFIDTALRRQKSFDEMHIFLILAITLIFALPTCLQSAMPAMPSTKIIVLNITIYACSCAAAVFFCLSNLKISCAEFFLPTAVCSAWSAIAKGLLYGLAAIPPVLLLSVLTQALLNALGFQTQEQMIFEWLADATCSNATRFFIMFAAVIVAPVIEEAIFRGMLFKTLLKTRTFLFAAGLSGLYFAVIHCSISDIPSLFLLGCMFSAGYAQTASILTPIVMHLMFNLVSLCLYFVLQA